MANFNKVIKVLNIKSAAVFALHWKRNRDNSLNGIITLLKLDIGT